jgi:hypothetical protein
MRNSTELRRIEQHAPSELSKQKRNSIMPDTRDEALVEKEKTLTQEIETLLPDFARSCRGSQDVVIIHQDSFAADYEEHEYMLFGKAIKFAGLHGKEVRVIGTNRETLATAKAKFVQ